MPWIQVERAPEFDFRSGPVPVETELDVRERGVDFSGRLVQLERPIRRGPRQLYRALSVDRPEESGREGVAVSETGVGQRVAGVGGDRLLEKIARLSRTPGAR